jgi:hypothetical protein
LFDRLRETWEGADPSSGTVVNLALGRENPVDDREDTAQASEGIGRVRLGAILALAAAAAFVTWLLLKDDGKDGKKSPQPTKTVSAASVKELEALPASVGHPVYWAGARDGFTYELTKTERGDIYIRYLPAGVGLNDKRPDFLTVGTYPYAGAIASARTQANRPGAFSRSIAGHGIAYSLAKNRRSVFFAYPRLDYLFEVYDPTPLRARRLVLSGRVRPVG